MNRRKSRQLIYFGILKIMVEGKSLIDGGISKTKYLPHDVNTLDRRQSKTLLTIDVRGSKMARNSVLDCHLSPVGRRKAIESSVSIWGFSTFVDSTCINVFHCRLSSVVNVSFIDQQ